MRAKILFSLFFCLLTQRSFAGPLVKNVKIYVITNKKDWAQSKVRGIFVTPSLYEEGFIHASTRDQLIPVLNTYYKGAKKLVVLGMYSNELSSHVEFEYVERWGQSFPHIFGPIKVNEVYATCEISSSEDGSFYNVPCFSL